MKMIIELNAAEATNAISTGALLGMLTILAETEAETKKSAHDYVSKFKKDTQPKQEPEASAPDTNISEVEIRAKFVALSKKGKKAELKELLTDFGVEKVSDLQPDQYQEAMTKLEAI